MASKNYFDQLGEGMKRLAGVGRDGYWNSLYEMVKDPSEKKIGKGIGTIPYDLGAGLTSFFGYLPEKLDEDNRR